MDGGASNRGRNATPPTLSRRRAFCIFANLSSSDLICYGSPDTTHRYLHCIMRPPKYTTPHHTYTRHWGMAAFYLEQISIFSTPTDEHSDLRHCLARDNNCHFFTRPTTPTHHFYCTVYRTKTTKLVWTSCWSKMRLWRGLNRINCVRNSHRPAPF